MRPQCVVVSVLMSVATVCSVNFQHLDDIKTATGRQEGKWNFQNGWSPRTLFSTFIVQNSNPIQNTLIPELHNNENGKIVAYEIHEDIPPPTICNDAFGSTEMISYPGEGCVMMWSDSSASADKNILGYNTRRESHQRDDDPPIHYSRYLQEIEELINKTQTLMIEWTKQTIDDKSKLEQDYDNLRNLIFVLIPKLFGNLNALLKNEFQEEDSTDSSEYLQQPYLLSAPLLQRTVQLSPSYADKTPDWFMEKLKAKERIMKFRKNKNFNSQENKNVVLPKKSSNRNSDWVWPEEYEKIKKNKKRLDQNIRIQDNIINKMTELERKFEELKLKNSINPNELTAKEMTAIRQRLDTMEERKSELVYKNKLLSETTNAFWNKK